MAAVHREVERAYPAAPDADLPALVDLVPDGGTPLTESVTTDVLTATYVDTADLRLTAAGLTLRDRSGGRDAGWHLKVPAAGRGARTEVRHPPGGPGHVVPEPLQALVRAVTTGEPLHPVAEVVTRRRAVRLVDATGRVLLELADDHVTARRLRSAEGGGSAASAPVTWREVEIELVDGDEHLLDVVEDGLRAAGLGPARSGTKVGRVLDAPDVPAPAPPDRRSSAGEVLVAYLAAQAHRLVEQDLAVRLDAPDAVHQMRVAARRLRTALRTFRPLLDREVTDPLRDELRLLGRVLGSARDAQVLRDRVADLDDAPVADLDARHRTAQDAVLRALGSTRYLTLVRGLTALAADPPLRDRPRTRRRATRVLPALVARRDRKVRRALRRAHKAPRGRTDALLHDARKQARTARYAAEVARPALGRDAKRYARAMEALQEVLGDHQDTVVARDRLAGLAHETADPRAAYAYGRLHAQEEARGREVRHRARRVAEKALRGRVRRWLG